ncbi:MAG: DUF1722 domain-containing protein [Methanocalculus sp. MSAO_Arc1]|uniref:YbgA family protein n=1 Tax=Methanocalculus TaxID=71151 RepID=UPI000FEF974B|nr:MULTISPECIES: DUF523 and DUF1722 domain-containing protein [unclassified Methanocalculus]MCP1662928.1 uncharacterized protein YbgA (DUF1722 family)/uncharacterized protein YbbK (DUF523 family) [Methanocalculus sp. AMF5]RQD80364.1 MAG: DUF1722 domain-containing protein [Methanocalculus sp. MSAO_Arc1]
MGVKRSFQKPVLVVSRCIEFDHVRYNGDMISSAVVASMKPFVTFLPVCPEVEIGLGIPRDTIRIVQRDGEERLIQPSTGRDLTNLMQEFCSEFLDTIPPVDGFIMKNKSPTSGISDVKRYPSESKSASAGKGPGFFGGMILDRFSGYPVEDEGRLRNRRIRDHFLTRIFLLADLRHAEETGSINALIRLHTENKLLYLSYSQVMLKKLGRIVANAGKKPVQQVFLEYREALSGGMKAGPRYTAEINVILHAFGFLKDSLSRDEKAFFLEELDAYRQGRNQVTHLKTLLRGWILRDKTTALAEQTWFAPFPDSFMVLDPEDTGRGREMWGSDIS